MHLFNNKKGPKKKSRIKEETETESNYITLDILIKFLIVILYQLFVDQKYLPDSPREGRLESYQFLQPYGNLLKKAQNFHIFSILLYFCSRDFFFFHIYETL